MKFGKLIGFLLFAVLLYVLWQVRQVLLLAFAAIVFATVMNRLVRQIRRLPVKRSFAVAIAVLLVLGTLIGVAAFIGPSLINKLSELTKLSDLGLTRIQNWYQQLRGLAPGQFLDNLSPQEVLERLYSANPNWTGGFFRVFSGSVDFLLDSLLVIVITIMLLANPTPYRRTFLLAFPRFYRARADQILTDCEASLVGWSIGILFNMSVITLCSGIGLWLLGVPLPMVNAVIAGLLTFVPNVGPVLSVIPPALMAISVAPWKVLAVIALYIGIQQIESNLLTPLVMKQQVSLLPAVTLLSQVIFAVFFGLLGLFLALPLVVILQVWLKELLVEDILNSWTQPVRKLGQRSSLSDHTQVSSG
ncbi:MAG: AI-2E family transporter [Leptolyngbya sp. SIO4C1]|nr:AI-2E family transporter [Leptolyngbya sp. SIO4C1]